MTRTRLAALCACVLVAGAFVHTAPRRPRLILLISVDQFRADYVDHYGHHWTRGLRRLLDSGARFTQAAYPYMNTVTCAGHATISTGTFPATHGLPLNAWFDRREGRSMACTEDPSVKNVSSSAVPARGGDSAWRLRVPTFSDELRVQADVTPKVVALSLKARSAITLGGHRPDLVTWYDGNAGFVTSGAYASGPVPFLQKYQAAHPIDADAGKVWDRVHPASDYAFDDDGLGEKPDPAWTRTFPHALPGRPGEAGPTFYALWEDTPFADAYLGRLAAAAVQEFKLGQGPGTDFLGVSFSTLDLTGHAFGPRSHEVQDVLLRLDDTIGRLLQDMDRLVGADQYFVALTSDHGVGAIQEQVARDGVDAGRIDGKGMVAKIEAALVAALGPGPHVQTLSYTDLYFKPAVYARLLERPEALREVLNIIESTPGVHRAVRSDDIVTERLGTDPLVHSAIYGFAPGRSGDVLVVPRPYFSNSSSAATHGTAYRYDARVPLVLAGPGIKAGEYPAPATPADIAPTLAWFAGITMARTDGRLLYEALSGVGPDPTRQATPTAAVGGKRSGVSAPQR